MKLPVITNDDASWRWQNNQKDRQCYREIKTKDTFCLCKTPPRAFEEKVFILMTWFTKHRHRNLNSTYLSHLLSSSFRVRYSYANVIAYILYFSIFSSFFIEYISLQLFYKSVFFLNYLWFPKITTFSDGVFRRTNTLSLSCYSWVLQWNGRVKGSLQAFIPANWLRQQVQTKKGDVTSEEFIAENMLKTKEIEYISNEVYFIYFYYYYYETFKAVKVTLQREEIKSIRLKSKYKKIN